MSSCGSFFSAKDGAGTPIVFQDREVNCVCTVLSAVSLLSIVTQFEVYMQQTVLTILECNLVC